MKEQKIITVTSPINERTEHQIVDEMAKDGWIVKRLSSSTYTPKPDIDTRPEVYISVTILFEREA